MNPRRQRSILDEARMFGRFARGLRGFLKSPLSLDRCPDVLQQTLRKRESSFLTLMRTGVYENPNSPFHTLLGWAGVAYSDLLEMVQKDGVEGALGALHKLGVHATVDEFKGRNPIRRGSQSLEVSAKDFDNPLSAGQFEGSTGGSRSRGTRLVLDLDTVAHDAAAHGAFLTAFGIADLPLWLWRPVAPGVAGTKKVLMHAMLRLEIERWFSQNRHGFLNHPKSALFNTFLVRASRRWGGSIPTPEHVPLSQAARIARDLNDEKSRGVHFDTNVSSAVRICLAAEQTGLSLERVFFRLGGEPLTRSKVEIFKRLGARATCHYSMTEVGHIGIACAAPQARDEVHLLSDKLALIVRPAPPPFESVPAFYLSSLLPSLPKIMINVASGDYGEVGRRDCGCLLQQCGFDLHLHHIRSYEKLTTGGMQFLGADLIVLLDEVLPSRIGGRPTDYQIVESERLDGSTVVQLVVSPRVGDIDENRCKTTVFEFLSSRAPENRMMVGRLRDEEALEVVRREPYATQASKILPLHLLREHR